MVYINEKKMDRIIVLGDKAEEYCIKNNIPIKDWIMWDGKYKDGIGLRSIHINGLSKDEITELEIYGFSPL